MENFIITIDEKTSQEIERTKYELDRECQNIARQLSKDLPFDGLAVKGHYDTLAEKVAYYDELKDQLSKTTVIPKATEKWGSTAAIAWTLDFRTCNVVVSKTNTDNSTAYNDVVELPQELTDRMKYLTINTKVCEELSDMIDATYPTIDTAAYREFIKFKESLDDEYAKKRRLVENEYAQPWVRDNLKGFAGKFTWRLVFESSKITIIAE